MTEVRGLLQDKSALVTGSTSGIGLAIARELASQGATVLTHGTDPDVAEPFAGYLPADLLDAQAPARLMESALAKCPGLSLLVANAGSFFDVPFLEMTPERWDKTMCLNLRSAYFLIQTFARAMVHEGRSGAVVITASTNGLQAELHSSAYDVSKGGLVMMTRSLALELARHSIRVNAIAPGLIRTPLTEPGFARRPDRLAVYENAVPLGRVGDPQDCAGAAAFLCSPAASYITGHVMVIDGGLTASQVGYPRE